MEPYQILIVDDDEDIWDLLECELSSAGYGTTRASNGMEALGLIKNRLFDLVVMDVDMPVLNGLDALKIIKKHIRNCR